MKSSRNRRVTQAKYLLGYTLQVHFDDGTVQEVDFSAPFLRLEGYYAQYRNTEKFKSFRIENDTVTWGENWDIIFPAWKLYENNFS